MRVRDWFFWRCMHCWRTGASIVPELLFYSSMEASGYGLARTRFTWTEWIPRIKAHTRFGWSTSVMLIRQTDIRFENKWRVRIGPQVYGLPRSSTTSEPSKRYPYQSSGAPWHVDTLGEWIKLNGKNWWTKAMWATSLRRTRSLNQWRHPKTSEVCQFRHHSHWELKQVHTR